MAEASGKGIEIPGI